MSNLTRCQLIRQSLCGLAILAVTATISICITAYRVSAKDSDDRFTVSGQVFDPQGKPVEADVRFVDIWGFTVQKEKSAPNGKFKIVLNKSAFKNPDWEKELWRLCRLLAVAEGYGVAWLDMDQLNDSRHAKLKLVPDIMIQGRILDRDNEAVAGVSVHLTQLYESGERTLDQLLEVNRDDPFRFDSSKNETMHFLGVDAGRALNVPILKTDSQGRFDVRGIGKDRASRKVIFGPVVTRTVYDDHPNAECMIDFDSGKVRKPPQNEIPSNDRDVIAWCKKSGVDAIGEGSHLVGVGMFVELSPLECWSSVEQVVERLKGHKPKSLSLIEHEDKLPCTFVFTTHDGARGALQFVKFVPAKDDHPLGIELRYKLLKAEAGANSDERIDSPMKEPASFLSLDDVGGTVRSLSWSADGRQLAVLSGNDHVRKLTLWDIRAKSLARVISETARPLFSPVFSSDGKSIACIAWLELSHDKQPAADDFPRAIASEIRFWNTRTGERTRVLSGPTVDFPGVVATSDLLCAAFSPNGRFLAAGGKLVNRGAVSGQHLGGEVCLWDLSSGDLSWSDSTTHTDIIYAVAFSADGGLLASAGMDKLIRIWNSQTGKLQQTLFGAAWDGIVSLSFSFDGKLLASGGYGREEGNRIRVWNVNSARLIRTIRAYPASNIIRVVFSPKTGYLFAIGQVKESHWQLRVWDVGTGTMKGAFRSEPGIAGAIAISPSGDSCAVGTSKGRVMLFALDDFIGDYPQKTLKPVGK